MMDLSQEQRQEVNAAAAELQAKQRALAWKRREAAARLPRLYAADEPDAQAIGAVYDEIFDAKRERIEAIIDTRNRVLAALTDEQRMQLKRMASHRRPWRRM